LLGIKQAMQALRPGRDRGSVARTVCRVPTDRTAVTLAARTLVRRLLELRAFDGRDALLAQVDRLQYVEGPITMMRLSVSRPSATAEGVPNPVPSTPTVLDAAGQVIGMLVLWLNEGYIDCLEYGWVTDEAPTILPLVGQLA
jgi:hypothetical protein